MDATGTGWYLREKVAAAEAGEVGRRDEGKGL